MTPGSKHPRGGILLAFLSLFPLLLIVYLGSHGRPTSDDFCHIISGLEFGPWGNFQYWRDTQNGSYSYYFLHGLTAPLDTQIAGICVAIIVIALLFGLGWLIVAGQRLLRGKRLPLAMITVLASALVWLSIYGLPSPLSIYFYAAAMRHTLPIAILAIALAACCAVAPRLRSRRRLATACVIFALVAFVNAGLAETFAIVQLLLLTTLPIAIYAMLPAAIKRYSLFLGASGCAATVLALLVMMTAPGVDKRLAIYNTWEQPQLRAPADLLLNILEHSLLVFTGVESNAAFIGMLAISLFLMSAIRRPAISTPIREPFQLARRPLLLCFLGQLMLLPLVWSQQSDNPLVFGRFSPTYMAVVAVHILLLLCLAASLMARTAINALLRNERAYWVALPIVTLGIAIFLFSLAQFRNIDWRASTYLIFSVYMLIFLLLWQFRFYFSAAGKSRQFAGANWLFLAFALCLLALVAVNQLVSAQIILYSLSFVSFAFAFSGLICGTAIAFAIVQASSAAPSSRPVQVIVYGSAFVAIAIWLAVTIGNARNIPQFQRFSLAWDERHELILASRDNGEMLNEVPKLTVTVPIATLYRPQKDYWQSSCGSAEITELLEAKYRA